MMACHWQLVTFLTSFTKETHEARQTTSSIFQFTNVTQTKIKPSLPVRLSPCYQVHTQDATFENSISLNKKMKTAQSSDVFPFLWKGTKLDRVE